MSEKKEEQVCRFQWKTDATGKRILEASKECTIKEVLPELLPDATRAVNEIMEDALLKYPVLLAQFYPSVAIQDAETRVKSHYYDDIYKKYGINPDELGIPALQDLIMGNIKRIVKKIQTVHTGEIHEINIL